MTLEEEAEAMDKLANDVEELWKIAKVTKETFQVVYEDLKIISERLSKLEFHVESIEAALDKMQER